MFIKVKFFSFLFSLIFLLIFSVIYYHIFLPIYLSSEIIIPYGLNPFDICSQNPKLWNLIKLLFIISFIISNLVISHFIFYRFLRKFFISNNKSQLEEFNKLSINNSNLNLLVGKNSDNLDVYVPESGLYQNFIITGTIGSGKTSSAMYPFTEQLMKYNSLNKDDKIAMLILDVKGNYYSQVKKYAKSYDLLDDLIIIDLSHSVFFNPLYKPNLKPLVLANRLKTILTLFSENNSEAYWLDKAEQILSECIKLCRLYNNNYVTFSEIHKLITLPNYFTEKVSVLKNLFISSKFNNEQIYELNASLDFFQKEFQLLDSRTKSILVSEITRMTNTFISDYDVFSIFCPPKEKLTFYGFNEVLEKGKIVVLNINIAEYSLLSKIIAAYLKLDFQTEVLTSLSSGKLRKSAFICDEYDKYCTKNDADFFSVSREAKCINIVSTQSYSSLLNSLKDQAPVKVILQNLINKIWFRTDDIFTIEEAQKQLGKEDKEKVSKSFTEGATKTQYSYLLNTFNSDNSNISESYSTFLQSDYIFDTHFFTQELETFSALTFLSNGSTIYPPQKLKLLPYFKK